MNQKHTGRTVQKTPLEEFRDALKRPTDSVRKSPAVQKTPYEEFVEGRNRALDRLEEESNRDTPFATQIVPPPTRTTALDGLAKPVAEGVEAFRPNSSMPRGVEPEVYGALKSYVAGQNLEDTWNEKHRDALERYVTTRPPTPPPAKTPDRRPLSTGEWDAPPKEPGVLATGLAGVANAPLHLLTGMDDAEVSANMARGIQRGLDVVAENPVSQGFAAAGRGLATGVSAALEMVGIATKAMSDTSRLIRDGAAEVAAREWATATDPTQPLEARLEGGVSAASASVVSGAINTVGFVGGTAKDAVAGGTRGLFTLFLAPTQLLFNGLGGAAFILSKKREGKDADFGALLLSSIVQTPTGKAMLERYDEHNPMPALFQRARDIQQVSGYEVVTGGKQRAQERARIAALKDPNERIAAKEVMYFDAMTGVVLEGIVDPWNYMAPGAGRAMRLSAPNVGTVNLTRRGARETFENFPKWLEGADAGEGMVSRRVQYEMEHRLVGDDPRISLTHPEANERVREMMKADYLRERTHQYAEIRAQARAKGLEYASPVTGEKRVMLPEEKKLAQSVYRKEIADDTLFRVRFPTGVSLTTDASVEGRMRFWEWEFKRYFPVVEKLGQLSLLQEASATLQKGAVASREAARLLQQANVPYGEESALLQKAAASFQETTAGVLQKIDKPLQKTVETFNAVRGKVDPSVTKYGAADPRVVQVGRNAQSAMEFYSKRAIDKVIALVRVNGLDAREDVMINAMLDLGVMPKGETGRRLQAVLDQMHADPELTAAVNEAPLMRQGADLLVKSVREGGMELTQAEAFLVMVARKHGVSLENDDLTFIAEQFRPIYDEGYRIERGLGARVPDEGPNYVHRASEMKSVAREWDAAEFEKKTGRAPTFEEKEPVTKRAILGTRGDLGVEQSAQKERKNYLYEGADGEYFLGTAGQLGAKPITLERVRKSLTHHIDTDTKKLWRRWTTLATKLDELTTATGGKPLKEIQDEIAFTESSIGKLETAQKKSRADEREYHRLRGRLETLRKQEAHANAKEAERLLAQIRDENKVKEGTQTSVSPPTDMQKASREVIVTSPKQNYRVPLYTYTRRLWRETTPEQARTLLPGSLEDTPFGFTELYFSETPDLALGQGGNQGVLLEFDLENAATLDRSIHGRFNTSKPGWDFHARAGNAEFIGLDKMPAYREALQRVTVKPNAKAGRVQKAAFENDLEDLERKGWAKRELPDGSREYTRPNGKDAPVTVPDGVSLPMTRADATAALEQTRLERQRVASQFGALTPAEPPATSSVTVVDRMDSTPIVTGKDRLDLESYNDTIEELEAYLRDPSNPSPGIQSMIRTGIDPQGLLEHTKTARAALLERNTPIRSQSEVRTFTTNAAESASQREYQRAWNALTEKDKTLAHRETVLQRALENDSSERFLESDVFLPRTEALQEEIGELLTELKDLATYHDASKELVEQIARLAKEYDDAEYFRAGLLPEGVEFEEWFNRADRATAREAERTPEFLREGRLPTEDKTFVVEGETRTLPGLPAKTELTEAERKRAVRLREAEVRKTRQALAKRAGLLPDDEEGLATDFLERTRAFAQKVGEADFLDAVRKGRIYEKEFPSLMSESIEGRGVAGSWEEVVIAEGEHAGKKAYYYSAPEVSKKERRALLKQYKKRVDTLRADARKLGESLVDAEGGLNTQYFSGEKAQLLKDLEEAQKALKHDKELAAIFDERDTLREQIAETERGYGQLQFGLPGTGAREMLEQARLKLRAQQDLLNDVEKRIAADTNLTTIEARIRKNENLIAERLEALMERVGPLQENLYMKRTRYIKDGLPAAGSEAVYTKTNDAIEIVEYLYKDPTEETGRYFDLDAVDDLGAVDKTNLYVKATRVDGLPFESGARETILPVSQVRGKETLSNLTFFTKKKAYTVEINHTFGPLLHEGATRNIVDRMEQHGKIVATELLFDTLKREGWAVKGAAPSKKYKDAGIVFGELKGYFMEKRNLEWLEKMFVQPAWTQTLSESGLYRGIRTMNAFFKSSVLAFWPAFVSKNHISNTLFNMLDIQEDAFNPSLRATASYIVKAQEEIRQLEEFALKAPGRPTPLGLRTRRAASRLGQVVESPFNTQSRLSGPSARYQELRSIVPTSQMDGDSAREAIRMLRSQPLLKDAEGRTVTVGELIDLAKKYEVAFTGNTVGYFDVERVAAKEVRKRKSGLPTDRRVLGRPSLADAGRKPATLVEEFARVQNFLGNGIRNGGFWEEAGRQSKEALIDYQFLTNQEKYLIKQLIPFWTFTARNTVLQAKAAWRNPSQVALQAHFMDFIQEARGEQPLTEKEQARFTESQKEGSQIVWKRFDDGTMVTVEDWGSPLQSAMSVAQDPVRALLSGLTPYPRTGLELLTKHNLYYGKPLGETADITDLVNDLAPLQGTPHGDFLIDTLLRTTGAEKVNARGQQRRFVVGKRGVKTANIEIPSEFRVVATNTRAAYAWRNLPAMTRILSTLKTLQDKGVSVDIRTFEVLTGVSLTTMRKQDVEAMLRAEGWAERKQSRKEMEHKKSFPGLYPEERAPLPPTPQTLTGTEPYYGER